MKDRRESRHTTNGREQARRDNRADGVERGKAYLPGSDEDIGYRAEWLKINEEIQQSSGAY